MATIAEARSVVAIAHVALAADKVAALTSRESVPLAAFLLGLRTAITDPETMKGVLDSLVGVPGDPFSGIQRRFDAQGLIEALKDANGLADRDPEAATAGYGLIALAALR